MLDAQLAGLEARVYRSLHGVVEACDAVAARADASGLLPQGIRARLLASDVRSRLGKAADSLPEQLALHAAAAPWPMLASRAAVYLVSTCDRVGQRVEAMHWAEASLANEDDTSAWHAEALMVAAMLSTSRSGADYELVERAMEAVRAACEPVMVAASAANFAEVSAECGELVHASHYADEAEALMRRHPEAAATLSWESVARARLQAHELAAADHAIREALVLEEQLGCADVNGDPWLTGADVLLARDDAPGALAMIEHPRRGDRSAGSSSTSLRELRLRARVMALLQRWEEAYGWMVRYTEAYERARSIESDRAVAESSAVVAMGEERKRSLHFERLALTDPLTGLPNRRHAERWLAEHAGSENAVAAASDALCVAFVDLDHFKRINDTHSHDAGDLVLQRVGALLMDSAGANDISKPSLAARMGGEEFLIAWSGITMEAAVRLGHAFCQRLRQTPFADIVGGMPVTASVGLAFSAVPLDPAELLRAADLCLYEAKRGGRNQLISTNVLCSKAG